MQEVLALTLRSMQQGQEKLDRISANLANATTPGYRRDIVAAQPVGGVAFPALVEQAAHAAAAASPRATPAGLRVHIDLRAGTLRHTGQKLDVALAGDGFLEVQTPSGLAYTRAGSLQLDARGRLVTAQGHAVLGDAGEIVLADHDVQIDMAGRIRTAASATPVARLRVVGFDDLATLERAGEGLFVSSASPVTLREDDIQVRQGHLENANVSPLHEMVQLMKTVRHFESMQKVALGYDDMTSQAIRKLGELS
ncbi:flagellar hook-basal body protein [Ramlibacter sp.]|uniref:flagellar hook-basal body protein n=1 Tax=Ramlibacter sp. TaxID=1917967 RepID=UPI0035B42503